MSGWSDQLTRFASLRHAVLHTEMDPREDPVALWVVEHAVLGDDWEKGVEGSPEQDRTEVLGRLAGACVLVGRLLVAAAVQALRLPAEDSVWDAWREELARLRLPRLREDDRLEVATALDAQKARLGGLTPGAVMLAMLRQAVMLRRFTALGERLLRAPGLAESARFEAEVVRHSRKVCDAVFEDAGLGKALPPNVRCPGRAVLLLAEHPDPGALHEAAQCACELVAARFEPGQASAAGLARLERALSPALDKQADPAIPDGPHGDKYLRWNKQDHIVSEQQYGLLEALWGRDRVQFSSVLQKYWCKDKQDDRLLKTALSRLNQKLADLGVPFGFHKRREVIVRE